MMPFVTASQSVIFPVNGDLYDSHGIYTRGMMANTSTERVNIMNEEEDFYYDLNAISGSLNSGFVEEPEWITSDGDFINWVRGFSPNDK